MGRRRSGANPPAPGGLAQDVMGSRDLQQQVLYLTVGTGWDVCRFQTCFTEGASVGPRIPWKGRNVSVDNRQRPRLTPGGQDVNSTYDKHERHCCILILFVGARLFLCCFFFSWCCACLCPRNPRPHAALLRGLGVNDWVSQRGFAGSSLSSDGVGGMCPSASFCVCLSNKT